MKASDLRTPLFERFQEDQDIPFVANVAVGSDRDKRPEWLYVAPPVHDETNNVFALTLTEDYYTISSTVNRIGLLNSLHGDCEIKIAYKGGLYDVEISPRKMMATKFKSEKAVIVELGENKIAAPAAL